MEPASVRYKNPGAMWGGNAISRKWGEVGNVALKDGTGQGNHIAVFPTFVAGICAQIDLWRTPRYRNKRFDEAIRVWSGGNSPAAYVKFVTDRVPGMTGATIINDAFLNSPMGIQFLKAQAQHEAGLPNKPYPAPAGDWIEAQQKVFGKPAVKPTTASTGTAVVVGAGTATVTAGAHQGWSVSQWLVAAAVLLVVAGLAAAAVYFLHRRAADQARKTLLVPASDDNAGLAALIASLPEVAATSPRKKAVAAKAKRPRKKAAKPKRNKPAAKRKPAAAAPVDQEVA